MDIYKAHQNRQQMSLNKGKRNNKGRTRSSSEKDAVKVVYISTPMKVKTTASKFRNLVQELTGRESDVVRIMERNGGKDTWMVPEIIHDHTEIRNTITDHDHDHHGVSSSSLVVDDGYSPSSSSEEFLDHFDGVLVRAQEGFASFCSNLLYDDHDQFSSQLDVLGSY